jgi:hypothetical protein
VVISLRGSFGAVVDARPTTKYISPRTPTRARRSRAERYIKSTFPCFPMTSGYDLRYRDRNRGLNNG